MIFAYMVKIVFQNCLYKKLFNFEILCEHNPCFLMLGHTYEMTYNFGTLYCGLLNLNEILVNNDNT